MNDATRPLRAVVFDLGGVVFPSPIDTIRDFESDHGLPHRFLSELILTAGDEGSWNRLERGELTVEEFVPVFERECAQRGHEVDVAEMMERIGGSLVPRPEMLTAIGTLRARGLGTGALTNNWVTDNDRSATTLDDVFDVVVESARVGLRKPDPRVYHLVCQQLGVTPSEAAFLDDLGANLKPARELGMTTIKVVDPDEALRDLAEAVGFPLPR